MEAHLEFFDADEQRRLDVVARVGAAHTAGAAGKRAVLRRIGANLQPNIGQSLVKLFKDLGDFGDR